MAVLTAVADADARAFMASYGHEKVLRLQGIAGGSVNSNFSIETERGRFFLRIYEERGLRAAENETRMLERLAGAGVPTPAPLPRLDGSLVSVLRGKAAALFPWRDGDMRCQAAVTSADASRVGEALARVHLAGAAESCDKGRFRIPDLLGRLDYVAERGDERFASWVGPLRDQLARVQAAHDRRDAALPTGLIHGDLFRDNVLWNTRGEIAALLDFESACEGTYAYDLMVTVLSWCYADDLVPDLAMALCRGYEAVRLLTPAEKDALYVEGCFAALRFTVTRITDYAMRADAHGPRVVKDWRRFLRRFEKLDALGIEGTRRMLGV